MVALQNKFKPADVQHISEPDGMIDIDLKTHIDNVIEINKKKLYKKRSCFKKLVFVIPVGILVTTFALLLLRTYLNNALNKQVSIEHETIPTHEYSNVDFREEYNFPKLMFDNGRENMNDEIIFKVKRDLQQSNAADSFIPLKSTPENLNYAKTPTLRNSHEMNASSTPSFLYFLSFYKGNHLKTIPNGLLNQGTKILDKTVTASLQNIDPNPWKQNLETDSINSYSTDKLSTEIDQTFTESYSTNFEENPFKELISSTEKIGPNVLTTDTFERLTTFATSKSGEIDLNSDDHKIETSSGSVDDNELTLDFTTEQLSTKYTATSEFDLKTSSDDSTAQPLTPKFDQIELNESKFQQNFNENNKVQAEDTSSPFLHQNVTVEQKEFDKPEQDTKNLNKSVVPSSTNINSNQGKDKNFNHESNDYVSTFDKTESDVIEEATISTTESFVQFSTYKSDKIMLLSDDLKIESSSDSVSYTPDENEPTIDFSTEQFFMKYTDIPEFNSDKTSSEDAITSKFHQPTSKQNLSENNKVTSTPLHQNETVESNDFNKHYQATENLITTSTVPNLSNTYSNQAEGPNFNSESTESVSDFDNTKSMSTFSKAELSTEINQLFEESYSTNFNENPPSEFISSTERNDFNQFTTDAEKETTISNTESFIQFSTFKTDKIVFHPDDLKIETSSASTSYVPNDENDSTIDYNTEEFSTKYKETSEIDSNKTSFGDTITPKSDITELNQQKLEENFSEVNLKEFSKPKQDPENLTKTSTSPNIDSNQSKDPNFNSESTESVSESNSTTFDENSPGELILSTENQDYNELTTDESLEEATFSNTESTIQLSTFKSDKIILHSDDLKIDNSSISVSNLPEQKESASDFSTEQFSTTYTESPHNFGLNNKAETQVTSPLPNEHFTIDSTDGFTESEISRITYSFPETTTHVQPSSKSDAIDSYTSYHLTSNWDENFKTKISTLSTDSTESTTGVQRIPSVVKTLKKLKYKLAIPPKYKNTTSFLTTKSDLHHSNPKPEIPSTLPNVTDLSESITDIHQRNSSSNNIDNSEYNLATTLEEETATTMLVQTNLYESTDQDNFNNITEMTTQLPNQIKENESESSSETTPTSFNVKARWNLIKPYTESFENESIFQSERPFDSHYQSTVTNEDNFEDKNETSFKFNSTNRNIKLSKRISKDFHRFLRKNRRATAMNQQLFSNTNNQFHSQSVNNNNKWHDKDFQQNTFEDDTSQTNEPTAANQQIQTNKQTQKQIPNQNYPLTVCPSGVKILQQSNPYPYYNNFPSSYQNILPLSSVPNNPYMNPPYPYPSVGNIPPYYNNPTLQLGGYYANNFYRDNSVPNGQYYVCSSLSNSYISSVPEVRQRNEYILQKSNSLQDVKNGTRVVAECPFGEYRCNDGSKCIKRNQYCDNAVHCNDMSDELECSCISRIEKTRICDGYLDCPDGEDEAKCFGCDEDAFNCDDWTPQDRFSTCIPLNQRCNGVINCPNAKDEEKCSILTEYFSTEQNFLVTYAKGYLYRNFGGRWYPVCRNPEVWANEACQLNGGGNYMSPLTHLIQTNTNYKEPYVSMSQQGKLHFDNNCDNLAVFVECALLVCGTRLKTRNYYRREEVDTSAEQIVGQSLNLDRNIRNLTDPDEDPLLGNSRVVGGKPSQPESWPWVVSIYRNGVFHCGGALINEYWIATAAHCVDKYWHYYFEIQAGILRRYSYSPMVQSRVASHVIPHQSYDKMKLKNDIALINLNNPVRYNRYVRPICLPSEITAGQNFMRNPAANTICSAIGWGATAEHGSDPDHLREVDVPVLKNCKYKEDREGHEICAGLREGGKDACQGDSGGPFICENPNVANQWYLAGIVSHGEGCARPNEPGVYTRVSMYLEWIHENIRSQVPQRMQPLNHCPGYTCRDTKHCIPKQRHCDKIIDCLYADDEIGCDRSHFSEIFKHAIMDNILPRTGQDKSPYNQDIKWDENQKENDNDEPDYILGQPQNPETSSELFETIAVNNSIMENTINNNRNSAFLCQKMLQTIDITKRCDKVPDCEDATDEKNCTCVDYLKYSHSEAVCDGVIDCFDASDEQNCPPKCRSNEFYCYLSNVCIQSYKQCDGKENCPTGEDERNCFALIDLKTSIELGMDSRPILNTDGFVSFYHNGTWKIVCGNWNTTEGAQFATQICIYLGYHDYKTFYKYPVTKTSLTVIQNGISLKPTEADIPNYKCVGLKVACSDTIDVTHEANVIIKQSFDHFEFIPWNTEIYVNGKYRCSGALLTKDWVVTSKTCFGNNLRLHSHYMAVLLGGRSKMYLNVRNVYEQVIRVVEYSFVNVSDIALLRLEKKVIVSSYIRPLGLNVKQYNVNENQICVVVGRNSSNKTELLYLKSSATCPASGFRCFTQDAEFNNSSCKSENYTFWGGCVVCRSARGWYPASVFFSHFGPCLKENIMWSSIQYWKANILHQIEQTPFTVSPPPCEGFRCNLGECIRNYQVCDGIPHCRDGEDEESNYCARKLENCTATQTCECKPSDLKCKNGNCVEKFKFCDKVNDCGDWSDEPIKCDCRSYLEVTDPKKLCDGVRNCRDRSDEDPYICTCSESKFRCQQSNLCVSQEVVCDQISDCPHGEDESYCIELTGSWEVQIRTAGLWHPGCFDEHLTTLQLEDICEHLGYIGTSADRNETVKKISGRPVMDPFIGTVVNRIDDQSLIIAKREGDKPFITFKEDYNCYRLFLNCL